MPSSNATPNDVQALNERVAELEDRLHEALRDKARYRALTQMYRATAERHSEGALRYELLRDLDLVDWDQLSTRMPGLGVKGDSLDKAALLDQAMDRLRQDARDIPLTDEDDPYGELARIEQLVRALAS